MPRCQARTPQDIEPTAEKRLEDEIDTGATRVVRGDGSETGTGPEALAETPAQNPRGRPYRQKRSPRSRSPTPGLEEPSWGSMYVSSDTDDEGDFGDGAVRIQTAYTPPSTPSAPEKRPPLVKAPSFSRLRATFNTIADVASVSASTAFNLAPSHPRPSSQASLPASPVRRRQRISSISMTSTSGTAPGPSIRRSQRSHPDISSLCNQWAAQGPANQTRTYRPETPQPPDSPHTPAVA